jgi:Raf kinase inhibitor-like YbhB/YbcL family protein
MPRSEGRSSKSSPGSTKERAAALEVRSPDFEDGQRIPKRHAFAPEGDNVPVRLTWGRVPAGTKELALLVDDPDAPRETPWVHWIVAGIPATATGLPAKAVVEGKNDFGRDGWGGPLPPEGHGEHHYRFHLYALDASLSLRPGVTKSALLDAIRGHVLAEGELVGTYSR